MTSSGYCITILIAETNFIRLILRILKLRADLARFLLQEYISFFVLLYFLPASYGFSAEQRKEPVERRILAEIKGLGEG